jgi:hypothetical protein
MDEILIADNALVQMVDVPPEVKPQGSVKSTRDLVGARSAAASPPSMLRYKALLMFQCEIIDEPILKKLEAYLRAGGRIIQIGNGPIASVEGKPWLETRKLSRVAGLSPDRRWLNELSGQLGGLKGVDGQLDKLWTCRRGEQVFVLNTSDQAVETGMGGAVVKIEAHGIWEKGKP